MKSILFAILTMMTAPAMAVSVTQLQCETIDGARVQIQFDTAIDPVLAALPRDRERRSYGSLHRTSLHK